MKDIFSKTNRSSHTIRGSSESQYSANQNFVTSYFIIYWDYGKSTNVKDPLLAQFRLSDDLLQCPDGMLDWHFPATLYNFHSINSPIPWNIIQPAKESTSYMFFPRLCETCKLMLLLQESVTEESFPLLILTPWFWQLFFCWNLKSSIIPNLIYTQT